MNSFSSRFFFVLRNTSARAAIALSLLIHAAVIGVWHFLPGQEISERASHISLGRKEHILFVNALNQNDTEESKLAAMPDEADRRPQDDAKVLLSSNTPERDGGQADSWLPSVVRVTEPTYFPAKELSSRPLVIRDIPQDLDDLLFGVPPQTATLRLFINESGDVDRVEIEEESLPAHAKQVIVDAFSRVKFQPGKIDGISVKAQLKIAVAIESKRPSPP